MGNESISVVKRRDLSYAEMGVEEVISDGRNLSIGFSETMTIFTDGERIPRNYSRWGCAWRKLVAHWGMLEEVEET